MQNPDTLEPVENPTSVETKPPDLPAVSDKPGYKTSSGQLTFLFTLAALVLSWFKIDTTPEQIGNIYEMIMAIVDGIGPILALVPVLMTYINSRGKIASNSITSTASIAQAAQLGGLGSLLGGKNWKDPDRYKTIAEIIAKTGIVPGPAGKVLDAVTNNDDDDQKLWAGTIEEQLSQILLALKSMDERVSKLEDR